ncbi:hypothetical protein GCM10023168_03690 [Fodinibacter luteus]|uniref:Uncharacterized protein n=1 Tax=Fodinibacter luteus TaxID=552064 RepID=A0ABP8JZK3_9MICO
MCAHCDMVLRVGPAPRQTDPGWQVDRVVELFDAAVTAEDDIQSQAIGSVARDELERQLRTCGALGGLSDLERLSAELVARHLQRRTGEPRTGESGEEGPPV